jgi:putative tricarboxylic transport membrane protein
MSTVQVSRGNSYVIVGIVGIILSTIYLGLALELPMGRMRQPGPGVFPLIAGGFTLLGSIATLLEGRKNKSGDSYELPMGDDLKRLLKVMLSLVGYLILLPIVGQLISSALFSFVVMRTLSTLSNVRLVVYSALLAGIGYWMFVVFFKLPLPSGTLFY